jgi:hypothetical protein
LPAHSHDFVGIGDAFKVNTAASVSIGVFCRNHERLVAWPKTGPNDKRAVTPDVRLDEITGEALRLRLRAIEDCDTENDTAQT